MQESNSNCTHLINTYLLSCIQVEILNIKQESLKLSLQLFPVLSCNIWGVVIQILATHMLILIRPVDRNRISIRIRIQIQTDKQYRFEFESRPTSNIDSNIFTNIDSNFFIRILFKNIDSNYFLFKFFLKFWFKFQNY